MTSGADKAIELALKVVRKGGKISVFSSIPSNLGYLNNEIYYNEITVMGAYSL
jgi:threonine dehydrogenase-like Zn-dependent dehydrogenase